MKIQELYENVSTNYDVLLTTGEAGTLQGLVLSTLNKLPQVRHDVVLKVFYRTSSKEYPTHTRRRYPYKIQTEKVYKGQPQDSIVEGTTFYWVVPGRKDYTDSTFMFTKVIRDYEKLYPLHV